MNNYAYYLSTQKRTGSTVAMSMSEKKALKLEPNNPAFLDTYGWIMYLKGNYKEAGTIYQAMLFKMKPNDYDVLETLWGCYFISLAKTE